MYSFHNKLNILEQSVMMALYNKNFYFSWRFSLFKHFNKYITKLNTKIFWVFIKCFARLKNLSSYAWQLLFYSQVSAVMQNTLNIMLMTFNDNISKDEYKNKRWKKPSLKFYIGVIQKKEWSSYSRHLNIIKEKNWYDIFTLNYTL